MKSNWNDENKHSCSQNGRHLRVTLVQHLSWCVRNNQIWELTTAWSVEWHRRCIYETVLVALVRTTYNVKQLQFYCSKRFMESFQHQFKKKKHFQKNWIFSDAIHSSVLNNINAAINWKMDFLIENEWYSLIERVIKFKNEEWIIC